MGQPHGQARVGLSMLDHGGWRAGDRARQRVKQGEDTRLILSLLVLRDPGSFNKKISNKSPAEWMAPQICMSQVRSGQQAAGSA